MGVTTIINGGQTMNPSTEDILQAVKEAHLPKSHRITNNKNIQMAANQLLKYQKMLPLPLTTHYAISEGLASLLAFNPEAA